MACRVEDAALHNRIWIAESDDGYRFTPRPQPAELPHGDPEFAEYTAGMYYDPRGPRRAPRCARAAARVLPQRRSGGS